jgi:hypothetical protein
MRLFPAQLVPRSNPGARARVPVALALVAVSMAAAGAPIPVANGDFANPANAGTVGGGVLGGTGSDVLIGLGPWTGTYAGVLGLLAPPTLTIDPAQPAATISGLLGVSAVGVVNNQGWFAQSLATNYVPDRFYVLSAEVFTGSALDLSLLADADVGIALTSGGSVLAASSTAAPGLVELSPLDANRYQLRLGYSADAAATGAIGLRLYNQPQGLLTASLLPSISFANVELDGRDVGAATQIEVGTTGDLLQAQVGQPFGEPIIAIVRDAEGDGVPGFQVTFTAPAVGASATLSSPTGGTGLVVTAVTDLFGLAVVYAVANAEAGCFRVTAEASGGALDQAVFHLRNYSDDPGQDSVYCNGFQ